MPIRNKLSSELAAVCLFSFLLGITLSLLFFRKDINSIKEYVEVMSFQLSTISISKPRVFLYVLFNRIAMFTVIFLISLFLRKRYIGHLFMGGTLVLYGVYVSVNIIIFGIKGIISGVVLILPQWFLYLLSYMKLIFINIQCKGVLTVSHLLKVLICLFGVILGAIIESYVTLPLFIKLIFK